MGTNSIVNLLNRLLAKEQLKVNSENEDENACEVSIRNQNKLKERAKPILLHGAGIWQGILIHELDQIIAERTIALEVGRNHLSNDILRLKKYVLFGIQSFAYSLRALLDPLLEYKLKAYENPDPLILDSLDTILSFLNTSKNTAVAILNLLHTLFCVNQN